jgi:hypothetical protein
MGMRIITLKSSLVNRSEASFVGGTSETRFGLAIYRWSVMKCLFLSLLVMSIVMASLYGPRISALQLLINR